MHHAMHYVMHYAMHYVMHSAFRDSAEVWPRHATTNTTPMCVPGLQPRVTCACTCTCTQAVTMCTQAVTICTQAVSMCTQAVTICIPGAILLGGVDHNAPRRGMAARCNEVGRPGAKS